MIERLAIHNREDWNRALVSLPGAHALQSWDWGDFKSRWGWTAERLLWLKADASAISDVTQLKSASRPPATLPVAAAQILRRPIPRTPWSFLYAAKGPALDYADWSELPAQRLRRRQESSGILNRDIHAPLCLGRRLCTVL